MSSNFQILPQFKMDPTVRSPSDARVVAFLQKARLAGITWLQPEVAVMLVRWGATFGDGSPTDALPGLQAANAAEGYTSGTNNEALPLAWEYVLYPAGTMDTPPPNADRAAVEGAVKARDAAQHLFELKWGSAIPDPIPEIGWIGYAQHQAQLQKTIDDANATLDALDPDGSIRASLAAKSVIPHQGAPAPMTRGDLLGLRTARTPTLG